MTRSRTIRPIEVTVSFGDVRATATIEPGAQRYGTRDALHSVIDSFADQLNLPHTTLTNGMNPWAPTQNGETVRESNTATNDPGFTELLAEGTLASDVRTAAEAFKEANAMELSEEDRAALNDAADAARARRDESTITEDPDATKEG